jgi:hypothetical protein
MSTWNGKPMAESSRPDILDAAERALARCGISTTNVGLTPSRVRFLMKEQRKLWLQSAAAKRASGDQEKAR